MAQGNYRLRVAELETAIVGAFAELDKADGSRIGLQEAIDASQSILREAYGDILDQEVLDYMEEAEAEDEIEEDFDESEDE